MSNNKNGTKQPRQGIDILLQRKGKTLQTGQKIKFTLVKGPSINRDAIPDPVNPLAPKEYFPLIAKFPESVVKPEFDSAPWNTARFYQQDVPKAQIDSDEEAEEQAAIENKKRWRRKRTDPPKRQWVLQEQVEFLETMMAKRQKKSEIYPAGKISSRYEGVPEHNPSHYVLLECRTNGGGNSNGNSDHNIQVTLLPAPPNANVAFSQPAARKTLTMAEAEQAAQDQRNQMTRYMMHDKQQNSFLNQAAKPLNQSKARLFGKLAKTGANEGDNEEGDDIMADVAFRDRKGNSKARKDLLNALGDENVKVDDDGVLGGAHDDEFGGKRRFGAFTAAQEQKKADAAAAGENKEKGNAGMAMEDGFYQRDVKAEYDELDYDVDEQFDDDDVDVGEKDMVVDSGYAQEEDDEDEGDEDMEGSGEQISGAEGLASMAGFKAMLAKAKSGETTDPNQAAEAANAATNGAEAKKTPGKDDWKNKNKTSKSQQAQDSHLDKLFAVAEKVAKQQPSAGVQPSVEKKPGEIEEPQVDENGLRIISIKTVQNEIWLNHGQMPTKRLMKLFDVGKKASRERQQKFREVVKELCTMKTDPVGGRMLVLKQHYSNMNMG